MRRVVHDRGTWFDLRLGAGSETSQETETPKLTRSYPGKEEWRRVAGAVVYLTKGRHA